MYISFISVNYFKFFWIWDAFNKIKVDEYMPLTEMSTRNLPGGKGRPARKADNLTAISEPIV
jgi:hypothetical protein